MTFTFSSRLRGLTLAIALGFGFGIAASSQPVHAQYYGEGWHERGEWRDHDRRDDRWEHRHMGGSSCFFVQRRVWSPFLHRRVWRSVRVCR
jgi:hypothetical protein